MKFRKKNKIYVKKDAGNVPHNDEVFNNSTGNMPSMSEAKINRYSDALSDEDRKRGWWYFTMHGVQPGSIPKDLNVLEIIDTAIGTFVKLDGILNTSELKKYDMKEKAPTNDKLVEASYGGAYDIEDDMYFTKDDLMEFLYYLIENLKDKFGYNFDVFEAYFDTPTHIFIELFDVPHELNVQYDFKIDMRKIK